MQVSVIIPVYNGAATLDQTLASFLRQRNFSAKDAEIILCECLQVRKLIWIFKGCSIVGKIHFYKYKPCIGKNDIQPFPMAE